MKLRDQIELFYKLASDKLSQANYDSWVSTQLTTAELRTILHFINQYSKEPYFKLEDFLPELYKRFDLRGKSGIIFSDIKTICPTLADEITQYLLQRWAEDPNDSITGSDFIYKFEKHCTSPLLMRKAMAKVIKHIMDFIAHPETVAGQLMTLRKSESFSKDFLLNLSKHLGLDVYTKYIALLREKEIVSKSDDFDSFSDHLLRECLAKDKLTIYDIAFLFREYTHTFQREKFQQILSKADDRAKEYIQRFVYAAGGLPLFILDSNYQPVNADYKDVRWPPWFGPLRLEVLERINPVEGPRWRKLFEDFKIIPI